MSKPRFDDEFGGTYILIEPGSFMMGDTVGDGLARENPIHEVEISSPFFIGQRPVTQMHWEAVMGYNPSKFHEGWSSGLRPVDSVTYLDAIDFISKLNESHNDKPRLSLNGIWRLPSEAEWEYCAKSGTDTKWCFGNFDGDLDDYGWHAGNSGASTREVGIKKPNLWEIHDMYGLISEWCQDNYRKDYSEQSKQSPYLDGSKTYSVRGGSWFTESDSTRSSARSHANVLKSSDGIGLRLVWEPL
ncbi:MAG: SUMF1/EgtB/PvdO family nonheme iron enzyme [Candidatus Thermoplasmatota archaeon]|nr:SUMF1/EgtB/PvdO family nonheme iron enzyme [Candidatus Thermoplasmatota archaeon]